MDTDDLMNLAEIFVAGDEEKRWGAIDILEGKRGSEAKQSLELMLSNAIDAMRDLHILRSLWINRLTDGYVTDIAAPMDRFKESVREAKHGSHWLDFYEHGFATSWLVNYNIWFDPEMQRRVAYFIDQIIENGRWIDKRLE